MAKNLVRKNILDDSSWTCPAGVKSVKVETQYTEVPINANWTHALDPEGNVLGWSSVSLKGEGTSGGFTTTPVHSSASVKFAKLNCNTFGRPSISADRPNYAIAENGMLYGWGGSVNGTLGDGTIVPKSTVTQILGSKRFIKAGSRMDEGGVALTTTGDLYAWGYHANGGVGDGTAVSTIYKSVPALVAGGKKWIDFFVGGGGTVFALDTDKALYAWGLNTNGQIGDGTRVNKSSPTLVLGGVTFRKIFHPSNTSNGSVFGWATDGKIYSWGELLFGGNLGNGTNGASSPIAIAGGQAFTEVTLSTTGFYGIAKTASGELYGWGVNNSGQLGLGDITHRSTPVLMTGLGGLSFEKIFATYGTTFGLLEDGTAYAWGFNGSGTIGDGTIVNKSSPVLVLGGLKFHSIHGGSGNNNGNGHTIGITRDGSVYVWGGNQNYSLGLGDTAARSSPVLMQGCRVNTKPTVHSKQIDVVPGRTYPIKFFALYPSFGTETVGQGVPDKMVLEYHG